MQAAGGVGGFRVQEAGGGPVVASEPVGDGLADLRRGLGGHEGDDRTAEAAAGHAGAVCAGLDGGRDGLVGLGPGEVEPVAERVV